MKNRKSSFRSAETLDNVLDGDSDKPGRQPLNDRIAFEPPLSDAFVFSALNSSRDPLPKLD
jgi:hypothetical protein